ncbi:MAG: hypothetical protein J2P37_07090 [Ktedonobacteraceae bacterium]|nr:hypothetical protein [Ktedonobacteraceae bacterium]MBO0792755.1 hypothetical protein [Ktedonobacteraceae bacterium]
MSSFAPQVAAPGTVPPDPTKHVRYTLGMVLGVDDFTQEFAYLSGRDQWMAHDLIGYGTICGLRVTIETDIHGPRVVVTPGVGITPPGQLVRVPVTQCASLNDWLRMQQQQKPQPPFISVLGSPPDDALTLYVMLCYRDCPTDQVPIPGEPCRDESEAMTASRLVDDFRLELRTTPPDQREEDALRDFVDWFSQVECVDDPDEAVTLAEFEHAIREAAHVSEPEAGSPPDFMYGSPPTSLRIPGDQACVYLRAAFRIWTTELRPVWTPNGCGNTPDEECLLLAELNVPVKENSGQWVVDDMLSVIINEDRRPYLIHLRLLQEWLLCGMRPQKSGETPAIGTLMGDVTGNSTQNTVERIRNINVASGTPGDGQVLTYNSATQQWQPKAVPPPTITLAGDVTGPPTNTKVARLQNALVSPTAQIPAPGQVLTVQPNGQWQAANASSNINAVEHPAGLPSYLIVAAGMVRGDGSSIGPVYNDLKASATGDSELTVTFKGYQQQDPKFQYIVKALPVFSDNSFSIPLVSFLRFDTKSFILHVANGGGTVKQDILKQQAFMIEVSQFFAS